MVLSLLGEKLDGPLKPFSLLNRVIQSFIAQINIQEIGLPSQFGRRMGVGIGYHLQMIQS